MGFFDFIPHAIQDVEHFFGGGNNGPQQPQPQPQPQRVVAKTPNGPTPSPLVAHIGPAPSGPMPMPDPMALLEKAKQEDQQKQAKIEKPGNDPVGNFINKYVLPSHVINQVKTLPNAIAANVAARTHNQEAYQHAEAALQGDVANNRGLLTPQQTEHPTAGNIVRGVAEGTAELAPYLVGGGAGKAADTAMLRTGTSAAVRQVLKRMVSAEVNTGAATVAGVANQAAQGQQVNFGEAAKGAVGPALLGAAFPGKGKISPQEDLTTVNHNALLNGEGKVKGVTPTTKFEKPSASASKPEITSSARTLRLSKPGLRPSKTSDQSPQLSTSKIKSLASSAKSTMSGIKSQVGYRPVGSAPTTFQDTLNRNLQLLRGNYESNSMRAMKTITQGLHDAGNTENLYHAMEDPSLVSKLNPQERALYTKLRTIQNATQQVKADNTGKEFKPVENNYVHREAFGKNSKLEQHGTGNRAVPTENAMRTTTASNKHAVYQVIQDNKGNRRLVSVKNGRATAWANGEPGADLGPLKANIPQPVKESYDPAQRQALADTAKNLGVSHNRVVKIRGNAAGFSVTGQGKIVTRAATPDDVILHELGHQADEKFGLQDQFVKDPKLKEEMRNLADQRIMTDKPSEAKYVRKGSEKVATLFQAYLHAPDLFKETAPKTFAKFDKFLKSNKEFQPIVNMKPSLKLEANVVGDKQLPGQFIDKTGKKYQLTRATTKEIEGQTPTRYSHDAVTNTVLDHANTVDAANAAKFKALLQNHPEYDKHIVNGNDTTPPADFRQINSRYFPGDYADKPTAHLIESYLGDRQMNTSTVGKMWQGLNSAATQAIIMNPGIHGQNLLAQAFIQSGNMPLANVKGLRDLPAGPTSVVRLMQTAHDMGNADTRNAMTHEYLQEGGHIGQYGKDFQTAVSKATGGATKLNARAMSNIDQQIRVLLYHANVKAGMVPAKAVNQVDTFLGKPENINKVAQNIGMFMHWLMTMKGASQEMLTKPGENVGAYLNAAALVGAITATDIGLRKVTGNPNAHVRIPGMLSLDKEVANVAKDVISRNPNAAVGDTTNLVTSHLAPAANALITQAAPSVLKYTPASSPMPTGHERINELINNLVAPSQNIGKVTSGKNTPLVSALNSYGGTYLPHAPGAPAAPNFKGGIPGALLNTPGAKPNTQGSDKTGYTEEQQYFNAYDKATAALQDNPEALSAFKLAYGPTKDPSTGKYVNIPNSEMTVAKSAALNAYPQALKAATEMNQLLKKQGQKIDPYFDLNPQQQKAYNAYETMAPGSPDRTDWINKNGWYNAFAKEQSAYFNSLPPGNPDKPQNPIKYPTPSAQVQSSMDAYNNIKDQTAKTQFLNNHPEVVAQFAAQFKYDNQVRTARGYAALKGAPQATPQVQAYINSYDSASKSDRAAMRNSNPGAYQKMIAYFDSTDLNTIAKEAGVNSLQGEPDTTSKELKDISSLASDIYQNPSGTYSIVPAGWMNGLSNSSGGGSGYSSSSSSSSSTAYPVTATPPSDASISKLRSLLNASTKMTTPKSSVTLKKPGGKGSSNYHVKKVSQSKTEKAFRIPHPKSVSYVSKKGLVKMSV